MNNENVGSIAYDARITTDDFSKDAKNVEKMADDVGASVQKAGNKGFTAFASDASSSFNSVADGLGRVLKSALLIGTTGSLGIGAAAKASWDQVSAVQQATVALGAYEKNGAKVNTVLSDLVAYARSDLGVLFNRKDLFEAAQSLKIMGDNTDELTDHVKIMSRSVGLGLSNWSDLSQIIGRVGSTGRLTGDDFDNLTKAGYKLDTGLRNTNITFDQLFKALDKGIPADAMAGQANTIVGLGVRLQTAFRGIGDAILGVNSDTGKFVEDGLGFRLVMIMGQLTTLLKDPALKNGFKRLGQSLGDFASTAIPILIEGITWIVNNIDIVVSGVVALASAFAFAKVAAIAFNLVISVSPVMLMAEAVTALVAALVYLQLRFQYVSKGIEILQPSLDLISQNLRFITNGFKEVATTAGGINWGEKAVVTLRDGLILLNSAIIATGVFIKDTARAMDDLYNRFINLTPVVIFIQYVQQVFVPALMAIWAAVVQNLLPALGQLWDAVTRLWNALNPALIDAIKILAALLGATLLAALYITTAAINIGVQAFAMYVSVISNVINWIGNLIAWFGNLVGAMYNFAKEWTNILWNLPKAMIDVFGTLQSIVSGLQGLILGALGDMAKLLYNAGKSVIEGFINGIKDKFGDVKSTLGDLTSKLTSWKGPASLDKVILKQNGQYVIAGFIAGLESMYGKVQDSLGGVTSGLSGAPGMGGGSLSSIDSALTGAGHSIENHIGTINIASEVDAESLMQKLTGDQEIVSTGLTPQRSYT